MADFSTARVGDKVWHIHKGWGKIVDQYESYIVFAPDNVPNDTTRCNVSDGRWISSDVEPSLFWGPITITEPPAPIRMKKVKVTVVPYRDESLTTKMGICTTTGYIGPTISSMQCGPLQEIEIEVEDK